MKIKPKEETRSREEIFAEINRHLEEPIEIPSCLDKVFRIIPTGSDSKELARLGIDLSKVNEYEARVLQKFCSSVDILDSTVIILQNMETKKYRLVQPKKSSRYFGEGRKKIRRKIHKRLGYNKGTHGVFVTLTYDPKKIARTKAWEQVGKHISNFIDNLNIIRKRKMNVKKRLTYIWVIEEQKGTGYPHVHMFFPGLNWLLSYRRIKKIWGKHGSIDIKKACCNISKYIMKYISKLKGYSLLALAMMWKNRRRIYSFSRKFSTPAEKKEKMYELLGMYNKKKGVGFPKDKEEGGGWYWAGVVPFDWLFDIDPGGEKEAFETMDAVEYLQSKLFMMGGIGYVD